MLYHRTMPQESAAKMLREKMTLFPTVAVAHKQKPEDSLAVAREMREFGAEKTQPDFALPQPPRNPWRKMFPLPKKGYAPLAEEETVWPRKTDLSKSGKGTAHFWPRQEEPSDYDEIVYARFHEWFVVRAAEAFADRNLGGKLAAETERRLSGMMTRKDFRIARREKAAQAREEHRKETAYKRVDYRRQLRLILRMACLSVLCYGGIFLTLFSLLVQPLTLGEATGNVWVILLCLMAAAWVGCVVLFRKQADSCFPRLTLVTLFVCVAALVSLYPCMRAGKLKIWTAVTVPAAVAWTVGASIYTRCKAVAAAAPYTHGLLCVFFAFMCLTMCFCFFNAVPFDGHDGIFYYTVNDDGTLTVTVQTFEGESSISVPQTIDGKTVTAVGRAGITWRAKQIQSVSLPTTVTRVDRRAFADCVNVQRAAFPLVALPYMPTARIEELTLNGGEEITAVDLAALPRLGEITLRRDVRRIGAGAFAGCRELWSVELSDDVTEIGEGAFADCPRLTVAVLGRGLTSLGARAFADCAALTFIEFPDSVTEIGEGAFSGCANLRKATLPSLVQKVAADLFRDCARLCEVGLSPHTAHIGAGAFAGCEQLQTVYYGGDDARWATVTIEADNAPLLSARRKKDRV